MSAPEGPLASPGFWLLQAAQRWKVEFNRAAADLGLTHTQFQVLAGVGWLEHRGERPTQQQAAEQAGIDRMMASKVLAGLEARGLLSREDAGRAKYVHLTDAGRRLTRRAAAVARDVDERLVASPERMRPALQRIAEAPSFHQGIAGPAAPPRGTP